MQYDVFISYSRRDTSVANRICDAFDRVGITYFIDRQGIGGGMEFPEVLAEAIVGCKIMLYLASQNSYQSKFTNAEITFAFNEKEKGSIIPYIIDGSTMPLSLRFVFSAVNFRTIEDHPIEPTLVDDVLRLLDHETRPHGQSYTLEDAKADFDKGEEYFNRLEFDKAIPLYTRAAEYGYADARFFLGTCYEDGFGVVRDLKKAVYWYQKAADQGDATAQCILGHCYYNGKGVRQDYKQAVDWYQKAADQGYANAQGYLGMCYAIGHGVSQDYKKAVYWCQKAADQGDATGQFALGHAYEFGQGVKKDIEQAVHWYRLAASQGRKEAQKKLEELGKDDDDVITIM